MKKDHDKKNSAAFRFLSGQIKKFKKLVVQRRESKRGAAPDETWVHDLRVITRRMRAALWVLRHDYDPQDLKAIQHLGREIKKLGKHLGERREIDVLLQISANPPYQFDTRHLKEHLAQANRHLQTFLDANDRLLIADLDALMQSLKSDPPKKLKKTYHVGLMKQLYKWETHLPSHSDEYHELRIFVKKIRYIFEAKGLSQLKTLKLAQEELGDLHDLDVLAERIGETPDLTMQRVALKQKIRKHQQPTLKFIARHL